MQAPPAGPDGGPDGGPDDGPDDGPDGVPDAVRAGSAARLRVGCVLAVRGGHAEAELLSEFGRLSCLADCK